MVPKSFCLKFKYEDFAKRSESINKCIVGQDQRGQHIKIIFYLMQ